jgi:hypothetical protein
LLILLVYVKPALKKTLERLRGEAYACSGGLTEVRALIRPIKQAADF